MQQMFDDDNKHPPVHQYLFLNGALVHLCSYSLNKVKSETDTIHIMPHIVSLLLLLLTRVSVVVLCVLQSDLEQYKTALMDAGCDLSPLNYIKQWK